MNTKLSWSSLVLAVIVTFTWMSLFASPGASQPEKEKITIGIEPSENSLLLAIAKEKGFLAKYNLEIDFKEYPSGLAALEGHLRGECDMATVTEIAFAYKSFENKGMRIISSIAHAYGIGEVIALRDRGISRPSDLKGKRIGTAMRTSAGYFLSSFLIFNRLSLEDVAVVEIPPEKWLASITNGVVDAVVVWDKKAFEIRQRLGERVVSWPAQSAEKFYWLLVSSKEWIDARPTRVERLLRAILDAEQYVRTDPAGARQLFASFWHLHPDYIKSVWPKLRFGVSLDQLLLPSMEEEARWAIKIGLINQEQLPNYLNFIYIKGLETVMPEAVTILR